MNITLLKPFYQPLYLPTVADEFDSRITVHKISENETNFSITVTPLTEETSKTESINRFLNRFLEISVTGIFQ